MGKHRLAAHMGVSLILLLAAAGGWGAYLYGLSSERQQERVLREEVTRITADRDRATTEAIRLRAELDRARQALDQSRRDLTASQQQVTTLTSQIKAREQAVNPNPVNLPRPLTPTQQPVRPAPAAPSRL